MKTLVTITTSLTLCLLMASCNDNQEQPKLESEAIKNNVLVEYVKTPLNKASAIDKTVNQHNEALNSALNEDFSD